MANKQGGYVAGPGDVTATVYWHTDHWCMTHPRHRYWGSTCDRVLTKAEVEQFTSRFQGRDTGKMDCTQREDFAK